MKWLCIVAAAFAIAAAGCQKEIKEIRGDAPHPVLAQVR